MAAEDTACRLVCDTHEALRLYEDSPILQDWAYAAQRSEPSKN